MRILVRLIVSILFISVPGIAVACGAPATPVVLSQPKTAAPAAPTNAPTALTVPTQAKAAPTTAPALEPTLAPTEPVLTVASETAAPPSTAAPAASQSMPLADYFGISTNGEVINKDQVRALAILSGAQMVRTSVTWDQVQPNPDEYNWNYPDGAFHILTDNNMEPLVLIMDNAAWGASTKCGPVSDLVAYEQFLRKLAARYPNVKYWGLYNEPDNGHGGPTSTGGCFGGEDIDGNGKPDYADFANQLQIAWRAIHAGNPDAKLVVGAVAFDNFDEATVPSDYPGGGKGGIFNAKFLDNVFAYMQANPPPPGEKYFDLLSFNFYNLFAPYWEKHSEGKGVSAKADVLTKLMAKYGLSAPLLVSETGDDSVTIGDEAQSAFLTKTFVRGTGSNIEHMIWWTFQDFSDSAPPPSNTWKYGLIDQNASPKPAYGAFQTATKILGDAQFVQPLNVQGGEGYLFNKGGAGVAVVWSASEAPVSISFAGKVLNVTDMYGAAHAVPDGSAEDKDAAPGRIAPEIGKNPTYVQTAQ